MAKMMIIAGLDRSLLLFRKELMESWLQEGHDVIAVAPGEAIAKSLKEMGVGYKKIPLDRTSLNPVKDLILLAKLVQIYRKERPDYLLLYTIKPVIYGSLAARLYGKIKVFTMITGLGYVFINSTKKSCLKRFVAFLYRQAIKRAEKVFFQNPDDEITFRQMNIVKPEKIVRINGSGVNLNHFEPAEPPDKPVSFLLIARLLREKGIMEYINAAQLVRKKYSEARFKMIAWDLGDNRSAVKQRELEEWNFDGNVKIYGETKDVRPHIAEASVYVLPSYREGTPRTVLEAMAMGRPIITTDAPGCRETVVEGVNGFLVPAKDSIALAEAMERFIVEPDLILKMGRESRRIAEEKYDVHRVNEVINQTMAII